MSTPLHAAWSFRFPWLAKNKDVGPGFGCRVCSLAQVDGPWSHFAITSSLQLSHFKNHEEMLAHLI